MFSEPFSVAQVFSASLVGFHSRQGWIIVGALFATALPGSASHAYSPSRGSLSYSSSAMMLLHTVERAKRCLDFCATILFLHALLTVRLYRV